ncbi:MAG: REDY-like protein HapK [Pseudomonadota bacterium]
MRVFVLFNLKPGVDRDAYERWARATDLPVVNALQSVDEFRVFKAGGLLGSEGESPYEYIETLDIGDMDTFGKELATEQMRQVAAEFNEFADAPVFVRADPLA